MKILGIALFIGGMAVSVGAPFEAREARMLAARGIETTATITEKEVRGGGRYSSPYAQVDIELEDEFGIPSEASGIIFCGEPEEVSVGDRVQITYDPENVAPPQFTECPQSQAVTIPTIIGVVVLAGGTLTLLLDWKARPWKRRWLGIPILVLGILFVGTSVEEDCNCKEAVYTGGALILLGAVPLVVPRKTVTVGVLPPPD